MSVPGDKPVVSPRRFVELLNARLPAHPLYRDGMQVVGVPRDAEHPRSLVCVGPPGAIGVCTSVEVVLRGEYTVDPDIASEWRHGLPPGAPNENRRHTRAPAGAPADGDAAMGHDGRSGRAPSSGTQAPPGGQ